MPNVNFDEQSMFEPIEFKLEGKDYVVRKVTGAMMDEVTDMSKVGEEGSTDVLARQLALLTDVSAEEFREADVRKLASAVKYVIESMSTQVETEKNVPEAEGK